MATNPDQEEFLEDDEHDQIARRSIFAAGWFRALIVLTVLAIIVVVSLPYLLNWLEPTPPPPAKTQAKSSAPAPGPAGASPGTTSPAPTLLPSAPTAPLPKAEVSPQTEPLAKGKEPKSAPAAPTRAAPRQAAEPAPAAKVEVAKSAPGPTRGGAAEGGSPGGYWVQVGAFREERNAEALAKQLRGENFPVQISAVTRGGASVPALAKTTAGQSQLFITGSTPDAVNAALKGKGTAQAVKGGVQVNPPFDLETAVSLSSSLKRDGFKVAIRSAKDTAPKGAAGGGLTYHIVRVGGYPDRTKAQQVRGELAARGHSGFLSQGAAR